MRSSSHRIPRARSSVAVRWRKFNREITSIQWDELTFRDGEGTRSVRFPHPAHDLDLDRLNALIREARGFAAFETALKAGSLVL